MLRDQRTIAGIGRSWVDESLWTAELSPFRQGNDLDDDAVERLHSAIDDRLGGALAHYEEVIGDSLPDKAPMPLQVHRRAGGGGRAAAGSRARAAAPRSRPFTSRTT